MAKTEPKIGMYRGTLGDRVRASSRPVRAALQSVQVSLRPVSLSKTNSVATAAITAARMIHRACRPWTKMPTRVAGSRAAITTSMMKRVVQ